jgi:hypothetical protein
MAMSVPGQALTMTSLSRGAALLRRGFEFRLAGDLENAITFYTRAIESEPSLHDVRVT